LRMVFVLTWTILLMPVVCICHLLHQVHFVCSMSSGIFTPPKLNTVIRCGTTGKVAMEPPCSFDFPASTNLYHVVLVPLSSSMELMCTLTQI